MNAPYRFVCMLVLIGAGCSCAPEPEDEALAWRPDIVILMVDALRADHLGVNGYSRSTTPNIDRLSLEGVTSNRLGIGTRLIARIGEKQIVRDVFPVNGFMGQSPPIVDIGVGDATEISKLTIRWPSGVTRELSNRDSPPSHNSGLRE